MSERTTQILTISLPPEMYTQIEQIATEEHRTKSELVREAFRHYVFARRWRVIRDWGEETRARLAIRTDDDIEHIAG
jgi:metal-responsive CopG/Arc/MetJ family transcriptional regulator